MDHAGHRQAVGQRATHQGRALDHERAQPGALVGPAEPPEQVDDRVELGVAQDQLAFDPLDALRLARVHRPHEQRLVVVAVAVRRQRVLEVVVRDDLGRRRLELLHRVAHELEVGDAVARHAGFDVVAVAAEANVGDLLVLAVALAPTDDGGLGRHRQVEAVPTGFVAVPASHRHLGHPEVDVGHVADGDPDLGLVAG